MKMLIKTTLLLILILGNCNYIYSQHINHKEFDIKSNCRTKIEFTNTEGSVHFVLFDNIQSQDKSLILYNEYFKIEDIILDGIENVLTSFIFIPYPNVAPGKYQLLFDDCNIETPLVKNIILMK